jgi:hypothetical protein
MKPPPNLGHRFVYDPPSCITTVERWTCEVCGRAKLRSLRHWYGSATEEPCQSEPRERYGLGYMQGRGAS